MPKSWRSGELLPEAYEHLLARCWPSCATRPHPVDSQFPGALEQFVNFILSKGATDLALFTRASPLISAYFDFLRALFPSHCQQSSMRFGSLFDATAVDVSRKISTAI